MSPRLAVPIKTPGKYLIPLDAECSSQHLNDTMYAPHLSWSASDLYILADRDTQLPPVGVGIIALLPQPSIHVDRALAMYFLNHLFSLIGLG